MNESEDYMDRLSDILKHYNVTRDMGNNSIYNLLQHYVHNRSDVTHHVFTGDVWDYLERALRPRRGPLNAVVAVTIIYGLIFLSGIFGNVCTCIVIAKNKYMHTATNYYLFNLAVADLLLLLIGLPSETAYIWSEYPWIFGEPFCIIRSTLAELSTNASILTITAFTIERYVAICHPMKAQTMSGLKRVVRVIIVIWLLASILCIPLALQFKLVYAVDGRGRPIKESASCGVSEEHHVERIFEISTFLFFVFPMTLVSVMYTMIAIVIRRSGLNRDGSDVSRMGRLTGVEIRAQRQARARRSVLKMLDLQTGCQAGIDDVRDTVAVVVAFFFCWAPFHTQRLMSLYLPASQWTNRFMEIYKIIHYLSGVCYFISCTINPILYSIMSVKFRQAFKQTVLKPKCCKHQLQDPRKKPYFSYKFSHKNGYSETSFTSLEQGSPARSHHNINHVDNSTARPRHKSEVTDKTVLNDHLHETLTNKTLELQPIMEDSKPITDDNSTNKPDEYVESCKKMDRPESALVQQR